MQPPPKPKGPTDLAEVERALSVLQGRHPEHERVRREEEEKKALRREQIDKTARAEHKKVLSRRVRVLGVLGLAAMALAIVGGLFQRELAQRGRVEQAADPYRSMGFVVVETSSRGAPGKIDVNVEPSCLLAVSTANAPIKATTATTSAEGSGPVLFCVCQGEHVVVTSDVPSGGGLALLRIDAPLVGGSRAFAFAPVKAGTSLRSDESCSEATLDAWIDAKRFPAAPPDPKWLATEPRRSAVLAVSGQAVATLKSGIPFAVVAVPKESCLVATSDAKADVLSLRTRGGAQPISGAGAIAWCSATEMDAVVQRAGKGEMNVVVVPAAKVGGLLGIHDFARAAGIELATEGVAPGDLPWDAKELLLATSVPEMLIGTAQAPDVAADLDARLVALSFATPNALTPETPADVFSYCDPALDERMRETICIFSGPQTWRTTNGESVGAVARAKLPFWLFGLKDVADPIALRVASRLATLARRLKREGFEPTTIEAITEIPTGVEVLGRTGEDAIVAVGLAPVPPFAIPYGNNGHVWSLDGDPEIVAIKTLEKVTLTTTMKPLPPKDKRHTVVFRRQAR